MFSAAISDAHFLRMHRAHPAPVFGADDEPRPGQVVTIFTGPSWFRPGRRAIGPGRMGARLHFSTERVNESLRELRRKRLYKIAAAYGVVAWLAVQVTDILIPAISIKSSFPLSK